MNNHLVFIDLSLSRIRNFLEKLQNPQDKIKNIIHVAGTNGKGSTCAFLRSILEGHGYSVNVFTSPHLVIYNERIRLRGELISNEYLDDIRRRLSKIEGYETLSVFELTAAIAFVAFYEKSADFTILEVGLGGRLDASNVIKNPLLSVITTIDYDHQNFLGNTLTQIAYEKAAIIKRNGTAITDYQDKSVLRAIKKYARHMQAALFCGGEDYQLNGNVLSYQNKKITLPQLPLLGAHQYYNVSTAIVSCINILKDKFDYDNLDTYLAKTAWAGRLQKVDSLYGVNFRKTSLFLDGAHNVSGSKALCGFIDGYESATNIHIFLGMLKKKDLDGFLANIAALKDRFNIVIYPLEIDGHESYAAEEILQKAREHNLNGNPVNLSKKLAEIEDSTGKNLIIICGSLYLLGKVLGDNL